MNTLSANSPCTSNSELVGQKQLISLTVHAPMSTLTADSIGSRDLSRVTISPVTLKIEDVLSCNPPSFPCDRKQNADG